MSKITRAVFRPGSTTAQISGLSMYDYGQELEIHGLSLPREVAVEYSLNGSEPTIDRIGYTIDGVTTAAIPDGILSEQGNLKIYIRVLSPDSGQTEYTITGKVNYREKPSVQPEPGEVNPFAEAIQQTSEAADRAEDSEKSAESWAHGHEDYPERDEDNAKYYAEQAKMHVEHVSEDAKKEIDEYVKRKEQELKGEPGTPGADGLPGKDGITPHIGENNHWWIGETDTGVVARGENGNDGVTPRIGENGHWYIGENDTGVTAQGVDGYTPQKGVDYFDGADGKPGTDGKSAYQYAQNGGYTGTEEEFTQKLATEYPTDVQINGASIVDDGIAKIPLASTTSPGAVKFKVNCGIAGIGKESGIYLDNNHTLLPLRDPNVVLLGSNYDIAIKYAMTDGKGAAWTDTEKTGAWSRLTPIKTAMDEVIVAGAHYYLGELTELSITLPDDAITGQEITVVWYNGETPATLAISGNMLDFDYVPGSNSRSEISALWDGMMWSIISNEQSVPATEVVTDEA